MTVLFSYILGASKCPDYVRCNVPLEINEKIIFFGPCSKSIRRHLKKYYLERNAHVNIGDKDVNIVGFNASNSERKRKIVWFGKVQDVMTYEYAYDSFSKDSDFTELFKMADSPLHLQPIYSNGVFIGYNHCSSMHEEDWLKDVINMKKGVDKRLFKVNDSEVVINPEVDRGDVFTLDCCFTCDNLFFAKGYGLEVTDGILDILRKAQPGVSGIDNYNIFGGDKRGNTNGKRGNPLYIENDLAVEFITEVNRNR